MKLTNRSKVVSNKEMTLAEKIYLPAIFTGMGITFKHAVRTVLKGAPAVYSYPEVQKPRAEIWRGQHVLKRDEEGRERCTACGGMSCRSNYHDCCRENQGRKASLQRRKICIGI